MFTYVYVCMYNTLKRTHNIFPGSYTRILMYTKEGQLLFHKKPVPLVGTGTLTFLNSRAESEIDEHKVRYIHV